MSIKRAKILSDVQLKKLLKLISEGENPERDKVIMLFSYKAGLRSCEMAGLTWEDLTDPEGKVLQKYVIIRGAITKNGKDRKLPIHPELYEALKILRQARPNDEKPVYALNGGYMTANNLTVYIWRMYRRSGFEGASSHSGRRTFITSLSRKHNTFGCSLKDVQLLAGHSRLSTTEAYIEPSARARSLVSSI